MRKRFVLLMLMTVSVSMTAIGCGGNWSNRDLDFVGALPDREMLKSKVPTSSTSSAPLTGVQTRRDGLVVGDPSTSYADTINAKNSFNTMIDNILTGVDAIRAYPPTSRTTDSRTWGPYADTQNVGFEFRLVITQVDGATFTWALESHKVGEDYFRVISGVFTPTSSLKEGRGSIVAHVKEFKNRLNTDPGLKALDQIEVSYVSDEYPHATQMLFTFSAGNSSGLSTIGYTSRIQEDASGALRFLESFPSNAQVSSLELESAWLPGGAGRAKGTVRSGQFIGFNQTECWGSDFLVTYFKQDWPGGATSGQESDCVAVPGL